jgi:16S rRNA (guanine1207-N2)-methyltransferase
VSQSNGEADARREDVASRVARVRLGTGEDARWETFLGGRVEVRSTRGVRGPERPLLEALDVRIEGKVLVVGTRDALLALVVGRLFPEAEVHWFSLDAYEYHRGMVRLRQNPTSNARFHLAADLPATGEFDWAIIPVPHSGEGMLAGELLREAQKALKKRGKLLAATDGARDKWLHGRILEIYGAATIHRRDAHGIAYVARTKEGHRTRERDFRRSFAARIFGRDLEAETRPGVFSHGQLDAGTLALSEVARIGESTRAVDLGCGSGLLGIAAALAAPQGRALLVDSSVRAVEVARRNAVRNGAGERCLVLLAHDLSSVREGTFDLVLANPPYFGDFRIVEQFARDARKVLVPGGELLLVTKSPAEPAEILRGIFGSCEEVPRRGYTVIRARR